MGKTKIERYINKEDLIKGEKGVKWKEMLGRTVRFMYDGVSGHVKIKKVTQKEKFCDLIIEYENEDYPITSGNLLKCKLGKILKKVTEEFKINIGEEIKVNNNKSIKILDRKYKNKKRIDGYIQKEKYYKCKCSSCGHEWWTLEFKLLQGRNCPKCNIRESYVEVGINDIKTTSPWMVEYFKDKNDGVKYTYGSDVIIGMVCPYCGREKDYRIETLKKLGGIPCICKDGVSYSEKFTFNLLEQLNINFTWQLGKKHKVWCNKFKYDFYFKYNNEEYIIETHGEQHYKEGSFKRTLQEEKQNDLNKYNLAIQNEIKPENYIVIDFRNSDLEWGREHILNSKLSDIFNLDMVDWDSCDKFALGNLNKFICEYWDEHKTPYNREEIINYLVNKTKLTRRTVINKLKNGYKYGWCFYTPFEPVYCLEKEEVRLSASIWEEELKVRNCKKCCQGKIKHTKGYHFRYATKEEIKEYFLTNVLK